LQYIIFEIEVTSSRFEERVVYPVANKYSHCSCGAAIAFFSSFCDVSHEVKTSMPLSGFTYEIRVLPEQTAGFLWAYSQW
jgi:hypothetical protein